MTSILRPTQQLHREGTAVLEALVVLPVLAIVFAGALALNAMYSAKLEAKARARRSAWIQADSGDCRRYSCSSGECSGRESELHAEGLAALENTGAGRLSLRSFVEDVGRFLVGTVTHGYGAASAPLPPAFRSARTVHHGKTTLLCNTRPSQSGSGQPVFEHACAAGLRSTEYANEVCP